MINYTDILIVKNCKQDFDTEVGIFIMEGTCQLVGDASLKLEGKNLYADIKASVDLSEYFPSPRSLANKIDLLMLTRSGEQTINSIGEQTKN